MGSVKGPCGEDTTDPCDPMLSLFALSSSQFSCVVESSYLGFSSRLPAAAMKLINNQCKQILTPSKTQCWSDITCLPHRSLLYKVKKSYVRNHGSAKVISHPVKLDEPALLLLLWLLGLIVTFIT